MMFEPLAKNPFKISKPIHYQAAENEVHFHGLEAVIPDVVYEHALLQNVDFEWGTWGRPVRSALGPQSLVPINLVSSS